MDTYTPQETVAPVAPQPKKSPYLAVGIGIIVVLAVAVLAWFFFLQEKPEPVAFPIIENGETAWYALSEGSLSRGEMPEDYTPVPATLLSEGDFSAVYAENGSVVTLSPRGVEAFGEDQARALLIDRPGLDYGSSALNKDASAALVYNESTNALDLFLLDRTRPLVLTYVGSLPVEGALFGVAFVDTSRFVVRTSEESFVLYDYSETDIVASGTVMLSSEVSFLSVPKAHAWTYPSPPVSTGATTASGYRCTGAQVANLGTASGSGTMPSVQTTVWSYMPTPGSLPASYNNGNYCIQAKTTVTSGGGGGPGGGGPGGGGGGQEEVFNILLPRAQAQSSSWTIQYTAHSGATKTVATDYYALTYTAVSSVTLSASPATVNQGSSAALTWSSSNTTSCTGTGFSTGGATSGTVSVSPSATTNYSISCTGTSGTVSDSEQVTVVNYPNLAAGSVTPTSATAGAAVTLSSIVTNSGSASTGAGFSTLFQSATSAAGANAADIGTHTQASAVAAAGSITATRSHTFTEGTWYVRACADKSSAANQGAITESNESDNCSAWTAVTVSAQQEEEPVSITFSASPDTIDPGESATLSWSSSGAETCISDEFETGDDILGSFVVSPLETTTYILTCYADAADAGGGGDGINVPFVISEWWTGGTSATVYSEWMHNNDFSQFEAGYGIEELCDSYAGGYDAWNLEVRETDMVGDAGTNLMWLRCYGVNNPTGTIAKPQETIYRPQGEPDYISYARSDATPGGSSASAVALATVTVGERPECSDELDNDRDGDVDLDDDNCDSGDDTSESSQGSLSCAVSNGTPQAGGSATYTVTPSGEAEAPYTWTPLNGQTCEGGTDTTENCTFPLPQIYQMRVTADGGETTLCPVVDTSCSLDSVSISASPDRVRAGNSTTVTWEADTSCNCSVSGPGLSSSEPNGSQAVAVTKQSRYEISCQAGAAEDFVIVNIVPTLIEF